MKTFLLVCATLVLLLPLGCDSSQSGRRLHLPKGNPEHGQAAFIALKCTNCHTVEGVDLPRPTIQSKDVVTLGGAVPQIRTVGDLITSIIHPTESISYKLKIPGARLPSTSPMPTVNAVMTVTQMIDLVRFLQPRYSQMEPPLEWRYP